MSQNLQNFAKFQKFQLDNLVDFEKCCKTHILLQKSEPIQPKTSNICRNFANRRSHVHAVVVRVPRRALALVERQHHDVPAVEAREDVGEGVRPLPELHLQEALVAARPHGPGLPVVEERQHGLDAPERRHVHDLGAPHFLAALPTQQGEGSAFSSYVPTYPFYFLVLWFVKRKNNKVSKGKRNNKKLCIRF